MCRHFCRSKGLSDPEGECYAGYYCNKTNGNNSPDPADAECPIGYYCPQGSERPLPCPPGSFSKTVRAKNETDCEPCGPGKYCEGNLITGKQTVLDCAAGHICVRGSYYTTHSSSYQIILTKICLGNENFV